MSIVKRALRWATTAEIADTAGTESAGTDLTVARGGHVHKLHTHDPAFHTFKGVRVYKSSDQTLTTSTVTVISFDTEDYDTDGFHDNVTNNSRITIPTGMGGYYLILATAQYATDATGERRARIHKNGTLIKQNNKMTVTAAGQVTFVECTAILNLAAGDYIELNGFHTKGSDLAIVSGSANTQLIVQYLGV